MAITVGPEEGKPPSVRGEDPVGTPPTPAKPPKSAEPKREDLVERAQKATKESVENVRRGIEKGFTRTSDDFSKFIRNDVISAREERELSEKQLKELRETREAQAKKDKEDKEKEKAKEKEERKKKGAKSIADVAKSVSKTALSVLGPIGILADEFGGISERIEKATSKGIGKRLGVKSDEEKEAEEKAAEAKKETEEKAVKEVAKVQKGPEPTTPDLPTVTPTVVPAKRGEDESIIAPTPNRLAPKSNVFSKLDFKLLQRISVDLKGMSTGIKILSATDLPGTLEAQNKELARTSDSISTIDQSLKGSLEATADANKDLATDVTTNLERSSDTQARNITRAFDRETDSVTESFNTNINEVFQTATELQKTMIEQFEQSFSEQKRQFTVLVSVIREEFEKLLKQLARQQRREGGGLFDRMRRRRRRGRRGRGRRGRRGFGRGRRGGRARGRGGIFRRGAAAVTGGARGADGGGGGGRRGGRLRRGLGRAAVIGGGAAGAGLLISQLAGGQDISATEAAAVGGEVAAEEGAEKVAKKGVEKVAPKVAVQAGAQVIPSKAAQKATTEMADKAAKEAGQKVAKRTATKAATAAIKAVPVIGTAIGLLADVAVGAADTARITELKLGQAKEALEAGKDLSEQQKALIEASEKGASPEELEEIADVKGREKEVAGVSAAIGGTIDLVAGLFGADTGVEKAIFDAGTAVVDTVTEIPVLGDAIGFQMDLAGSVLGGAGDIVSGVVGGAFEIGEGLVDGVGTAVGGIVDGVSTAGKGFADGFGKVMEGDILGGIADVGGGILKGGAEVLGGLVEGTVEAVGGVFEGVGSIAVGVGEGIFNAVSGVGEAFGDLAGGVLGSVGGVLFGFGSEADEFAALAAREDITTTDKVKEAKEKLAALEEENSGFFEFLTDDEEVVKARKIVEDLEKQANEERRAQLTDTERAQEDLEAAEIEVAVFSNLPEFMKEALGPEGLEIAEKAREEAKAKLQELQGEQLEEAVPEPIPAEDIVAEVVPEIISPVEEIPEVSPAQMAIEQGLITAEEAALLSPADIKDMLGPPLAGIGTSIAEVVPEVVPEAVPEIVSPVEEIPEVIPEEVVVGAAPLEGILGGVGAALGGLLEGVEGVGREEVEGKIFGKVGGVGGAPIGRIFGEGEEEVEGVGGLLGGAVDAIGGFFGGLFGGEEEVVEEEADFAVRVISFSEQALTELSGIFGGGMIEGEEDIGDMLGGAAIGGIEGAPIGRIFGEGEEEDMDAARKEKEQKELLASLGGIGGAPIGRIFGEGEVDVEGGLLGGDILGGIGGIFGGGDDEPEEDMDAFFARKEKEQEELLASLGGIGGAPIGGIFGDGDEEDIGDMLGGAAIGGVGGFFDDLFEPEADVISPAVSGRFEKAEEGAFGEEVAGRDLQTTLDKIEKALAAMGTQSNIQRQANQQQGVQSAPRPSPMIIDDLGLIMINSGIL